MMKMVLMFLMFLISCGDSDTWDQQTKDEAYNACVNSFVDVVQGRKFCSCLISELSSRFGMEAYANNYQTINNLLEKDGTIARCQGNGGSSTGVSSDGPSSGSDGSLVAADAGPPPARAITDLWDQQTKDIVILSCIQDVNKETTLTSLQGKVFCECFIDALSKICTINEYMVNAEAIAQILIDDGTIERCVQLVYQ